MKKAIGVIKKESIQRAYDKNMVWYTVLKSMPESDTAIIAVNNPYTDDGSISLEVSAIQLRDFGIDYVIDSFYDFLCENPGVIARV